MTTTPPKRRALGRGLSALLPDASAAPATAGIRAARDYAHISIEDIYPSPDQPRRRFADDELEALAQSIRTYGVIQPVVVRAKTDGGYLLIAGERRWRAAQRAGITRLPAAISEVSPADAFERALVENIQRADLNAIEEAEALRRLCDEHGLSQEQIAERIGKDRSTVANSLRLLKLPVPVRAMVEEGKLSMGHARALLAIDDAGAMTTLARTAHTRGLSVRATEALVRAALAGAPKARKPAPKKSPAVRDLEARIMRSLGSPVSVTEDRRGRGGSIEIRYANLDDLDRLLERLLERAQ